jgi:transposase-like protein
MPIERPRCPKCQLCMMLVRIEARPADADLRRFECRKCKQVDNMLAEDPLKSNKAG